jgi:hypothetical protein
MKTVSLNSIAFRRDRQTSSCGKSALEPVCDPAEIGAADMLMIAGRRLVMHLRRMHRYFGRLDPLACLLCRHR